MLTNVTAAGRSEEALEMLDPRGDWGPDDEGDEESLWHRAWERLSRVEDAVRGKILTDKTSTHGMVEENAHSVGAGAGGEDFFATNFASPECF